MHNRIILKIWLDNIQQTTKTPLDFTPFVHFLQETVYIHTHLQKTLGLQYVKEVIPRTKQQIDFRVL